MYKIIIAGVLALAGWLQASILQSTIVLAHSSDPAVIEMRRADLQETLETHPDLRTMIDRAHAKVYADDFGSEHLLAIGPFVADEHFALIYLELKSFWAHAVVVERPHAAPQPSPAVTQSSPKHAPTPAAHDADDEEDQTTIWIALFGLAVIGILYMFLSSDQLRRIKAEHTRIQARQKELEVRQHTVLAQMGENIQTLAKETVSRTHTLAEHAEEGGLMHADVQKVIEGEKALLGMTDDLIKFLQIKAHKVTIQHASFDFNNVLHEVAGTLQSPCARSDQELVFDVARDVPKIMQADSLHIAQVLINLIEHLMCHTTGKEVYLSADIASRSGTKLMLRIVIRSDAEGIDEATFFDAHYDEASGQYSGLGLFVAKELTELMGGKLTIEPGDKQSPTRLGLVFPVAYNPGEQRQYHLPDSGWVGNTALVVDPNPDVVRALKHFLAYYRMETTVLCADKLTRDGWDPSSYDLLVIDQGLLDAERIDAVAAARDTTPLRVIALENLYASQTLPPSDVVDVRMKKPLTQQHVHDILVQLTKQDHRTGEVAQDAESLVPPLEVYRGNFVDNRAVKLSDFGRFAGRRLMIVEDNIVNQNVLRGIFGKAGLSLTIANHGQEALDHLERDPECAEMILMDISMPVMDGFVATRRIHQDARYRHIPIVTLTALASEHEVEKMFECGANGYLSKPLKIGKLFSAMERFLAPTQPALAGQPVAPDVPVIDPGEGLDHQQAIDTMRNNALLYREVLNEFRAFYGDSDAHFEELIRGERYEELRTLCLDLRGLTGSIGARGVYDVVSQTLDVMTERKFYLAESLIQPYREELSKLNEAIAHYLH